MSYIMYAHKMNELMVKHAFDPIGIGEPSWAGRLYTFVKWLSDKVGDAQLDKEMTDDEELALEVYSRNQTAIEALLKKEGTFDILSELAKLYGELAHEVNNKQDIKGNWQSKNLRFPRY